MMPAAILALCIGVMVAYLFVSIRPVRGLARLMPMKRHRSMIQASDAVAEFLVRHVGRI